MRCTQLSLVVVLGLSLPSCEGTSRSPTDPQADSDLNASSPKSEVASEPGRVSGGGHIFQDEWDVSVGGQARVLGGEPVPIWADGIQFDDVTGHWVIQFHHVSVSPLNGATFRSTRVQRLQFFENPGLVGCTSGARVHLEGVVDGALGWTALLIVVGGSNGSPDTLRLRVWGPAGETYETNWDFPNESTCAGSARTSLDSGNATVRFPS